MSWINKPPLGVSLIPDHPHLRGLVGWWPFLEGAGGETRDESGNGNNCALTMASPSSAISGWNPGKFGRTLAFDGVDDLGDCGNGESLNFDSSDAFSNAFWLKPDQGDTAIIKIMSRDVQGGSGRGYSIIKNFANGVNVVGAFTIRIWNTTPTDILSVYTTNATKSNDGDWHHYMYTYDGTLSASGVKLYEDGVEIPLSIRNDTLTGTIQTSEPFFLTEQVIYLGRMEDVRLYKRKLLQPEIQDIKNDPFAAFVDPLDIALLAQLVGFAGPLVNATRLRSTVGGGLV